jgi:hypothetical protein
VVYEHLRSDEGEAERRSSEQRKEGNAGLTPAPVLSSIGLKLDRIGDGALQPIPGSRRRTLEDTERNGARTE